ncbi:MAG: S41 family peptidase [Lachnospiraceae bacterium]|nr:S41 family peptidase [Lachnospiraceae bacterium]
MKAFIKRFKVLIIIISTIVILAAGACGVIHATTNPYAGSIVRKTATGIRYTETDWCCIGAMEMLTREQALEDLEFSYKYFKRVHPITYKGVPEELAAKYEEAKATIMSADEISVNRLAALIEGFIHPINDGHSFAYAIINEKGHYMLHKYPENSVKIIKVNGEDMESIFERNNEKYSYETYRAGLDDCRSFSRCIEGLDYLEIDVTKPVVYTFEMEDGSSTDVTVAIEDFLPVEEMEKILAESEDDQNSTEEERPFVYYDIYEDYSLAVLTLNECVVNSVYLDTLEKMFTEVKEKNIQNVCVDLRYNGGGNSLVTQKFLRYCDVDRFKGWPSEVRRNWMMIKNKGEYETNHKIKKLLFSGDIYLLTSHDTYSAAKDFAMIIKDNNIGQLIGEASGNNPNSYGDVSRFLLPNSRILLSLSYKKWYRIDYKEGFIEPDIPCNSEDALDVLKEMLKK